MLTSPRSFARSIYTGKWSAVSLCSGIIAGLVGITPGAGYLGTPAALCVGFVTAIACNYATGIKVLLKIDDAVDTYALHGIGGFVCVRRPPHLLSPSRS